MLVKITITLRLGKILAKHQPSLRTTDFYQQLIDEYQLVFAKDLIKNLLSDQRYKSDLIHFNQLGYELMAQQIYQLFFDKGVLE